MESKSAEEVLDETAWVTFIAGDGLPSLRASTGAEKLEALRKAGFKVIAPDPYLAQELRHIAEFPDIAATGLKWCLIEKAADLVDEDPSGTVGA